MRLYLLVVFVLLAFCNALTSAADICSTKSTVLEKNENGTIKLVAAFAEACVDMDNSGESIPCSYSSDYLKRKVEGGEEITKITVATIDIALRQPNFVDAVKKASIPGWGTMQQFLDCTPVKIAGSFITLAHVPPTWSYPPESMQSHSQSLNSDAANLVVTQAMETLTDTLSKLFPEMGITAKSKEKEVLLYENLRDVPDFVGYMWIAENGLIKTKCIRHYWSFNDHYQCSPYKFSINIVVQEAEHTFARLAELDEAIKRAINNMGLQLTFHLGHFDQVELLQVVQPPNDENDLFV